MDEFLRVWATNHDPNSDQPRTGSYMYFYGFEERAERDPADTLEAGAQPARARRSGSRVCARCRSSSTRTARPGPS